MKRAVAQIVLISCLVLFSVGIFFSQSSPLPVEQATFFNKLWCQSYPNGTQNPPTINEKIDEIGLVGEYAALDFAWGSGQFSAESRNSGGGIKPIAEAHLSLKWERGGSCFLTGVHSMIDIRYRVHFIGTGTARFSVPLVIGYRGHASYTIHEGDASSISCTAVINLGGGIGGPAINYAPGASKAESQDLRGVIKYDGMVEAWTPENLGVIAFTEVNSACLGKLNIEAQAVIDPFIEIDPDFAERDQYEIEISANIVPAVKGIPMSWGYSPVGDGNNFGDYKESPTKAMNPANSQEPFKDVVSISAGSFRTLALKSDGSVWAWGIPFCENLDPLSKEWLLSPTQPPNWLDPLTPPPAGTYLRNVQKISSGHSHSLALLYDKTVVAWGYNAKGALGNDQLEDTSRPYPPSHVPGLSQIKDIAAGWNYSLAVKDDGTIWAWGDNSSGQLGDGTYVNRTSPVQVNGLYNMIEAKPSTFAETGPGTDGQRHSLALGTDGTVWTWGANDRGQLGHPGAPGESHTTPDRVLGLPAIKAVDAGPCSSLALDRNGEVWAWGGNDHGQLGDGTWTDQPSPVKVLNLTNVVAISAGGKSEIYADNPDYPNYIPSVAIKSDGSVWAWGSFEHPLAAEPWTLSNIPFRVIDQTDPTGYLTDIKDISIGLGHIVALKAQPSDGYTAVGNNVSVPLVNLATHTTPLTVSFNEVTTSGVTDLVTGSAGFSPPVGFMLGDPPTYYSIETSAEYSGPITICIDYRNISYADESEIRLWHYENGQWVDITTSKDVVSKKIYGTAQSFSSFAIFEPSTNHRPTADAGVGQSVSTGSDCLATVSLDGTGSSDSDGDSLTFLWTWDGGIATEATPTLQLPKGSHRIFLVVRDGKETSESDYVDITVNDTTAPTIQISDPVYYKDATGLKANKLTVSATDNCSSPAIPTITRVEIYNSRGILVKGATVFSVSGNDIYVYSNDGFSIKVTVTATDQSGNTSTQVLSKRLIKFRG